MDVATMTERPIKEGPVTERANAPAGAARSDRTARRRRPGPGAVIAASAATFAMLFGFLTYQLRSGHDPAIGAASTASSAPSKVLVRRVIRRRVVTTVVPSASSSAGTSTASSPSSSPVVTSSAPTTAAPAPAPVTTSAS
jgi:hypothetical protein